MIQQAYRLLPQENADRQSYSSPRKCHDQAVLCPMSPVGFLPAGRNCEGSNASVNIWAWNLNWRSGKAGVVLFRRSYLKMTFSPLFPTSARGAEAMRRMKSGGNGCPFVLYHDISLQRRRPFPHRKTNPAIITMTPVKPSNTVVLSSPVSCRGGAVLFFSREDSADDISGVTSLNSPFLNR